MKKIIPLLFIVFTLNSFGQNQQDSSNYDWFEAKYIKFKPGKATEARPLLQEYLYKANEITGRPVLTFESDMGDWGHIAYLHLKDGPKQLSYENPDIELKWWNAVIKLAGPEQKANEIIEQYNSCILREKHNLFRRRNMQGQMGRRQ